MKHKKTVTEAVLAANRANAQSSTGPRTKRGKSNARHNALRHGILAKRVVLENDEEQAEFQQLLQACNGESSLEELLEKVVREEIATLVWMLQITLGLETRELSRRQDVGDQVDGVFHSELKLPISDWDLPLDRAWDCERIIVRAVAGKDESNSTASRGPAVWQNQVVSAVQKSRNQNSQEAGHLEVEAVLGSSLEKMTRYRSALKRDLDRAIEMLRALQAERRKQESGGSSH